MFIYHGKRTNDVAQTKFVVWLLYVIGIPVYGFAILLNITTWKSDILFIVALLLGGLKAYHDVLRNKREERKARQEEILRDIEIKLKEDRKHTS